MKKFSLLIISCLLSRFALAQTSNNKLLHYLPNTANLQCAGSIGVASIGVGWQYGNNWNFETQVLAGYLPKFDSNSDHFTLTIKQVISPFSIEINERLTFEPITMGLFICNTFGDPFWTIQPDQYPDGYYDLSTGLRFNLFVGEQLNIHLNANRVINEIGLYYEFNVSDMYVIADTQSKYLNVFDYVNLSFGIKAKINYAGLTN